MPHFTVAESAEIRTLFYEELVSIHASLARAGSYHYLCLIPGQQWPIYTHAPMGRVMWHTPWL